MHKLSKLLLYLSIILLQYKNSFCQEIYEPLSSSIYSFLDNMSIQKVISVNNEVKPYSRQYINSLLNKMEGEKKYLTTNQALEYEFYKEEFILKKANKLYNFCSFAYSDSLFNLTLSPILGLSYGSIFKKNVKKRWWGAHINSSFSDWFSANLEFTDNGEYGETNDVNKKLSPKRAYFINIVQDGWSQYSDVSGYINFNWKWGSISLIKDYQNWGHGEFGQLILSDKVSSYPQIKLFLNPVSWLRFYYIHGWLTSNIPDSINFYPTGIYKNSKPILRKEYKGKYIAANFLCFDPCEVLSISLGNSVVYSDFLKPEYFIPFLLYKFQDHNAGRENDYGSNGQLFLDLSLNYPSNVRLYGTAFLDMTSISDLLKNDSHSTWLGYTIGIKEVRILNSNFSFTAEYTKIGPWVYEHYIPTTTYKHLDYTLGHWIGQNADDFKFQLNYNPFKNINLFLNIEKFRKGGLKDISLAYQTNENLPFLYGALRKEYNIGFEGRYEIFYGSFIKILYNYYEITDEDKIRTPSYMIGSNNNIEFQLCYGI